MHILRVPLDEGVSKKKGGRGRGERFGGTKKIENTKIEEKGGQTRGKKRGWKEGE